MSDDPELVARTVPVDWVANCCPCDARRKWGVAPMREADVEHVGGHSVVKRPPRFVWREHETAGLVPVAPANQATNCKEPRRLECVDCGLIVEGSKRVVHISVRKQSCGQREGGQ